MICRATVGGPLRHHIIKEGISCKHKNSLLRTYSFKSQEYHLGHVDQSEQSDLKVILKGLDGSMYFKKSNEDGLWDAMS